MRNYLQYELLLTISKRGVPTNWTFPFIVERKLLGTERSDIKHIIHGFFNVVQREIFEQLTVFLKKEQKENFVFDFKRINGAVEKIAEIDGNDTVRYSKPEIRLLVMKITNKIVDICCNVEEFVYQLKCRISIRLYKEQCDGLLIKLSNIQYETPTFGKWVKTEHPIHLFVNFDDVANDFGLIKWNHEDHYWNPNEYMNCFSQPHVIEELNNIVKSIESFVALSNNIGFDTRLQDYIFCLQHDESMSVSKFEFDMIVECWISIIKFCVDNRIKYANFDFELKNSKS